MSAINVEVFASTAMLEPEDAAPELRRIADLLAEGFTLGQVVDANGERVGWWSFDREGAS